MKALSLRTWFEIVLVILVVATLGYFFGFYMLFMHGALEIFYYALLFVAGLSLYSLLAWTYETLFAETAEVPAPAK